MSVVRGVSIAAMQWAEELEQLRAEGRTYFDFLAATDLGAGRIEVVAHVMMPDATQRVMVRTVLAPGESLASLVGTYPAAAWHEREAFEMVGVGFTGHPDLRPLVTGSARIRPLLKSEPLDARVEKPWPGLAEPGVEQGSSKRRRALPVPGVPDTWRSDTTGERGT